MAKETNPLVELTEDARKHIDAMKGEIEEAEKNLDAMVELGLDVSVLREKVEWAKKAREIILKR
ncbi:unnamed protein product, partial [marine sediment metagenome]